MSSDTQKKQENVITGNQPPCRNLADHVLSLSRQLLLEQCAKNNDQISCKHVKEVFDQLGEASGGLSKFYSAKYKHCSADLALTFEKQWKLSKEFQDKLSNIVSSKTKTVITGHLQTVGLDNLKGELGESWSDLAERVYETAEFCIANRLSPSDTFLRTKDNEFIICFAELSGEAALFKARAIEVDITEKLLGQNHKSKLEPFKLDTDSLSKLAKVDVPIHEIEISPEEASSDNLVDSLLHKLERAKSQLQKDTEVILNSLATKGKVRPRVVQKLSSEETNIALLDWDFVSHNLIMKLENMDRQNGAVLPKLDQISLLSAATFLFKGWGASDKILSIGIHSNTLREKDNLNAFLKLCEKLGDDVRKQIVFNLLLPPSRNIPDDAEEMCNILRPFCMALSVQIHSSHIDNFNFDTSNLSMIVMNYKDFLVSVRQHPAVLASFAIDLSKKGVTLFVDKVPHGSKMNIFNKHRIEFLAFEHVFEGTVGSDF